MSISSSLHAMIEAIEHLFHAERPARKKVKINLLSSRARHGHTASHGLNKQLMAQRARALRTAHK